MIPEGRSAKVEADSPKSQIVSVGSGATEQVYDLVELLDFRSDLSGSAANHAALQQFWETIAVDIAFRARTFEEEGYAKWWAHSRRYARYIIKLIGQRETLDLVKDWVIMLFSGEVDDEVRLEQGKAAWKGYVIELHGSDAAADAAIGAGKAPDQAKFLDDMYVYWRAGWTYEAIMRTNRDLQEQAEKVRTVANVMQDRSFKMREFIELEKAKFGNIGPLTIDEIINRVAGRVLKKVSVSDGASCTMSPSDGDEFLLDVNAHYNSTNSTNS